MAESTTTTTTPEDGQIHGYNNSDVSFREKQLTLSFFPSLSLSRFLSLSLSLRYKLFTPIYLRFNR